jgi:hypothetical protein
MEIARGRTVLMVIAFVLSLTTSGACDLYPLQGVRREVAVLNTWFGDGPPSSGAYPAANQGRLCKPSLAHRLDSVAWHRDRELIHGTPCDPNRGTPPECATDRRRPCSFNPIDSWR